MNTAHQDLMLERTALMLCCMFDQSPLPQMLDEKDFADPKYGQVFTAIQKNFSEKGSASFVDLCTEFDAVFLMTLMTLGHPETYWPAVDEDVARKMRELRIRRMAANFDVTIDEAKNMIGQFSEHAKKLTDLLPNAKRETLDIFNELHDAPMPWIPTGFPSMDSMVHMHVGNLVTFGARTRHGKTSMLINIAVKALERKERVDFLTKEMEEHEVLLRVIECMVGKKFKEAKELVNTELLSFLTIVKVQSVQDVATICSKTDAALVMVDYIQVLDSGKKTDNRVAELEYITSQLKSIASGSSKCVVTASQINRKTDTADRELVLSDLRGSGSIEQDSNIVILFYNYDEEDKIKKAGDAGITARALEGKSGVEVLIAKNRMGKSGKCTLEWDGEVCRFIDLLPPLAEYTNR